MPTFWDSSVRFDLLMSEAIGEITAMNRLQEKLAKAAGVVQRQSAKIEARADALIAREEAIEQRTDKAFEPHETLLDGQEKGLDTLEASLRLLSNGAPLEPSSDSPASPQAAQGQPTASGPVAQGDLRTFDRMG